MSRFVDAPTAERCDATIILRDRSTAQCGRRGKHPVDDERSRLCSQHLRMFHEGAFTFPSPSTPAPVPTPMSEPTTPLPPAERAPDAFMIVLHVRRGGNNAAYRFFSESQDSAELEADRRMANVADSFAQIIPLFASTHIEELESALRASRTENETLRAELAAMFPGSKYTEDSL